MIRRVALPLLLVSIAAPAHAASERTWSPLVRGSLPAGDPQGATATSRGTIALGPETKELAAPPSPYLWALALKDGRTFAASGDGGEIWSVPEDGSAAKLVYDAAESQAQTLTFWKGDLVAGFNPGAKVVRLSGERSETLFKAPSESYVWAVLPEAKGGALHVAVGSPGRIYRVEAGAPVKVELESGDGAVRALAYAKDGKLLAGTDGRGLLERVDGDGKRFVLFDAPRREISSISVAPDGTIWFAAIGQEEADAAPPLPGAAPVASPAPLPAPPPADPKKGPPGQLYRMRPDGFAELVWTAPGPSITSVLARADSVVVATGDPGAVWFLDADGVSRKVLDPSAGQATALVASGSDVLVATANPSKVFRLTAARKTAGKFEAGVLDAGGFAHWGSLRWDAADDADAKIEVATRSGNTLVPDASWSAWSAAIPSAGGPIASPAARYLQWRVSMSAGRKSPDPELTSVDVIYRVENRAPKVDAVVIEDPGVTLAPKADALLPGYALPPDQKPTAVRKEIPAKRGWLRGWRAARWTASDADGDELVYDVWLRGSGTSPWIPLAQGIPETYTTWDATTFPDGRYELRVVARDDASNGTGGAKGERIAGPFDSDTTPPKIEGLAVSRDGARLAIRFTATDAGIIGQAQVAIDGGDWTPIAPADGLADSTAEKYDARIPAPASGEHLVVVRVQDRASNQASAMSLLK